MKRFLPLLALTFFTTTLTAQSGSFSKTRLLDPEAQMKVDTINVSLEICDNIITLTTANASLTLDVLEVLGSGHYKTRFGIFKFVVREDEIVYAIQSQGDRKLAFLK